MNGLSKCSLSVVWKNIRKNRAREKYMEIEDWMSRNKCDIAALNETGLIGREYMELGKGYEWVGVNKCVEAGRSGGVGFIVRSGVMFESVESMSDDVCFIKIGRLDSKYEWLLGSIYMNCEGVRKEENKAKANCIMTVVKHAMEVGLKVMIGGDMNGHIWELDKCENWNGRLIKSLANELGLQVLNCILEGYEWTNMVYE